ncbi:MAG: metallopeptidase family protein [Patescibacteria group bacterium]|jgi:predicted Zn-dependent protease with MMP-like domain
MDREKFEEYIAEAVAQVPASVRNSIVNVAFVLEDDSRAARQTEEEISVHGSLLGLYQGVSLPHRSVSYSGVLPDKITLFKHAIERTAGNDPVRIRLLIHEVVHHEIAHYLGMDEDEVRAWEQRRKKR